MALSGPRKVSTTKRCPRLPIRFRPCPARRRAKHESLRLPTATPPISEVVGALVAFGSSCWNCLLSRSNVLIDQHSLCFCQLLGLSYAGPKYPNSDLGFTVGSAKSHLLRISIARVIEGPARRIVKTQSVFAELLRVAGHSLRCRRKPQSIRKAMNWMAMRADFMGPPSVLFRGQ